jgi:hypothetical protein
MFFSRVLAAAGDDMTTNRQQRIVNFFDMVFFSP